MKYFYSLVKVSPNAMAGDEITIGLIAFSDKYYFGFSSNKINFVNRIVQLEDRMLIKMLRREIEHELTGLNKRLGKNPEKLIKFDSPLDFGYFSHLGVQHNNLIRFSKPVSVASAFDEITFRKLFSLAVDKNSKPQKIVKEAESLEKKVQVNLIDKVKDNVHTNYRFNENTLSGVYFPFTVDCIGRNGSIVAVKSIDFESSEPTIDRTISHFYMITNVLSGAYNTKGDITYIIANEPAKENTKVFQIWQNIKDHSKFQVKSPDETAEIVDYIQGHEVSKFLTE